MARTVVALYDELHDARRAVKALLDAGFPQDDVSIAAHHGREGEIPQEGAPHAALGTENVPSGSHSGGVHQVQGGTRPTTRTGASGATAPTGLPADREHGRVTGTRTTTGEQRTARNRPPEEEAHGNRSGEGAGIGAGVGAVLGGITGLLVGASTLAIPGAPIILMGPLATTLVGAGVGAVAGGLLGALVGAGIPEEHAHAYAEGVRRGGTLVMVRAAEADADRAAEILGRFGPVDIEERSAAWRAAGWTGYSPEDEPFDADQVRVERARWAGRESPRPLSERVHVHAWERGNEDVLAQGSPESRDRSPIGEEAQPFVPGRVSSQAGDRPAQSEFSGTKVPAGSSAKPGSGVPGSSSWEKFDTQFRRDFEDRFGRFGNRWEEYRPAYQYGFHAAQDPQYTGRSWSEVEPQLRRDYERRYGAGSWTEMKAPVQYAFLRGQQVP